MESARAAMKTNQLDGYISSLESGYTLEEAGEWRVITTATPFVEHFITHVIFARDELIASRPQAVRAFLRGWFGTIAFMKANKAQTVSLTAKVLDLSPAVIGRAYSSRDRRSIVRRPVKKPSSVAPASLNASLIL